MPLAQGIGRIFVIADAFDAITSDRLYRDAQSNRVAVDEAVAGSGAQFDPAEVEPTTVAGAAP